MCLLGPWIRGTASAAASLTRVKLRSTFTSERRVCADARDSRHPPAWLDTDVVDVAPALEAC